MTHNEVKVAVEIERRTEQPTLARTQLHSINDKYRSGWQLYALVVLQYFCFCDEAQRVREPCRATPIVGHPYAQACRCRCCL